MSPEESLRRTRIGKYAQTADELEAGSRSRSATAKAKTPPPSSRPGSVEGGEGGRKVCKKAGLPMVGTVAAALASDFLGAESAHVYTCSADAREVQHCTLLSTGDEYFPWTSVCLLMILCTIGGGVIAYSFHLFHLTWIGRRVKPAEPYADADADGEKTHRALISLIRSRIRLADHPHIQRQEMWQQGRSQHT